jgi:hypothetical protein
MAKTIRKRIEGLLAFLKHHRLTNASQEGFNLNSEVGSQGLLDCSGISGRPSSDYSF